jgi:hypothetical protein
MIQVHRKTSNGFKSCLIILACFGCGVKGKNVGSKFFKDIRRVEILA